MKAIFLIVEGYTELEFAKSLLTPFLINNGVDTVIPFPVATNAPLGKKGGNRYEHLRPELLRSVKYNSNKIVTTFFDYYALPPDFPNYSDCQKLPRVDERIACLESAIKADIAPNNPYFFPYIQKYEFEALLFSSNRGFERYYESEIAEQTAEIIGNYPNPEEINDNSTTAPSKRLIKIVPEYNKVLTGNILALEIGLETILQKCPRFNNWIEGLLKAAQN